MRDLALKLTVVLVFYFIGERLVISTYQIGQNSGLGFWRAIREIFDYQTYSTTYFVMLIIFGILILVFDLITPGKSNVALLALFSSSCGAYFYVMFYGYDYFSTIDRSIYSFGSELLPQSVGRVVGVVLLATSAVVPPLLVLVTLKLLLRRFFLS